MVWTNQDGGRGRLVAIEGSGALEPVDQGKGHLAR